MNNLILKAPDPRQSPQWGEYMKGIGWQVEWADKTQVFIRKIPYLPFSFIKIQRPIAPITFKKIDQVAKKYHALSAIVEPHLYRFKDMDYLKHGYEISKMHYSHTATIKLDLTQSLDKLFKSFSENARRNIRKSQTNNLDLKIINLKKEKTDLEFRKFFDLLVSLTKMKKFFIPGYSEFYKKMNSYKKTSYLLFALEKGNKYPLAGLWLAYDKQVMFYTQTGILARGYQTLANYFLAWEAFKLAKKLNLKVFDFEAIYDPRYPKERRRWVKFSEFKRRFHGEIVEYPPSYIKFYSLPFKIFYSLASLLS